MILNERMIYQNIQKTLKKIMMKIVIEDAFLK